MLAVPQGRGRGGRDDEEDVVETGTRRAMVAVRVRWKRQQGCGRQVDRNEKNVTLEEAWEHVNTGNRIPVDSVEGCPLL